MLSGLTQSEYTVAVILVGSFYPQAEDCSFTVASNVYNHFSDLICYLFIMGWTFVAEKLNFLNDVFAWLIFSTSLSKSPLIVVCACYFSLPLCLACTLCSFLHLLRPHPLFNVILWAKLQTKTILHRRSQRILEKFLELRIVTPFIVLLHEPVTHAKENAFECRQSSDTTDKPLSKLNIRRAVEHYQLDPEITT